MGNCCSEEIVHDPQIERDKQIIINYLKKIDSDDKAAHHLVDLLGSVLKSKFPNNYFNSASLVKTITSNIGIIELILVHRESPSTEVAFSIEKRNVVLSVSGDKDELSPI